MEVVRTGDADGDKGERRKSPGKNGQGLIRGAMPQTHPPSMFQPKRGSGPVNSTLGLPYSSWAHPPNIKSTCLAMTYGVHFNSNTSTLILNPEFELILKYLTWFMTTFRVFVQNLIAIPFIKDCVFCQRVNIYMMIP